MTWPECIFGSIAVAAVCVFFTTVVWKVRR